MVKRLVVGLLIGLVVGLVLAVGVVKGLGMAVLDGTSGAILAYVGAAITGVLVGFVAGKPIWAQGGKIEAGLKAAFGALLAAGGMFALRRWVGMPLDLSGVGAGAGALGLMPAVTFPLISTVLGILFEVDNTPPTEKEKAEEAKRKASIEASADAKKLNGKQPRVAVEEEIEEEEVEAPPSRKAKR
jgi:hypothetical protein